MLILKQETFKSPKLLLEELSKNVLSFYLLLLDKRFNWCCLHMEFLLTNRCLMKKCSDGVSTLQQLLCQYVDTVVVSVTV